MSAVSLFKPLPEHAGAASDACAAAVRGAILRGDLAPGARLPPERALAARFGVSRLTLRAGLSQLAAAGLLHVRQGSGYVVQDYRSQGGPDLLTGILTLARQRHQLGPTAADLLAVRRQLAHALFERLAERWTSASAARIEPALLAFAQAALTRDHAAIARADLGIVGALVAESGSAVLGLCLNPIARVLTELGELRAAMFPDPQSNLAGWRAVIAALDAGARDLPALIVAELARRDRATLERLERSR